MDKRMQDSRGQGNLRCYRCKLCQMISDEEAQEDAVGKIPAVLPDKFPCLLCGG